MAKKKFVVAAFEEQSNLFSAVEKTRKAGYKIHDVYTPFPMHGLDQVMGLRETSLHTAGFIYGILGTATALGCMSWIFMSDWPQIYDGKPHFALPAFIPITFELTVLFASIGMVYTFCWLCQLAPFVKKHIFHPRQSDDLFIMAIECTPTTDVPALEKFITNTGTVEVAVQEAEAGWWWGRFDRDQQIINEDVIEIL